MSADSASQTTSSRSYLYRLLWVALILALVLSTACSTSRRRVSGLKPPIRQDVAEKAPVGLRLDVTKFNWQYVRNGSGLKVTGTVKNNTRQSQQPVVLYAMLFDETGRAVGMGETRISPSVLRPGDQGTFTLLVGTSRPSKPRPIRYLRLLTNFQNS